MKMYAFAFLGVVFCQAVAAQAATLTCHLMAGTDRNIVIDRGTTDDFGLDKDSPLLDLDLVTASGKKVGAQIYRNGASDKKLVANVTEGPEETTYSSITDGLSLQFVLERKRSGISLDCSVR